MRKTSFSLFLLLILVVSIIPQTSVYAEDPEPSGVWDNRYSYTVDYGNGTHKSTLSIGPQVFWDNETESWGELRFVYDYSKKYYLMQNAHMSLRVYEDKPPSYFDPDHQNLCVEKEIVLVEYNDKGKWKVVDLKNPVLTVLTNSSSEIQIVRTLSGSNGVLNVTFTLRPASRLKHDIVFSSFMSGNNTFRVHFRQEGVPSLKVKYANEEKIISGNESIGTPPIIMFGEDNNNLVLSEYLWELGVTNETTGEWTPTVLQDVILDVEGGKGKMDIIIGNYVLAENESLLIDPDSNTWLIGQSSDDANNQKGSFSLVRPTPAFNNYDLQTGYDRTGIRWTNIAIPSGSTISSAYVSVKSAFNEVHTDGTNNHIYGSDEDDAATFSTLVDLDGRSLTSTYALWSIPKMGLGIWYNSPEIDTEIQEIIDRDNWESGNDLAVIYYPMSRSSRVKTLIYSYDNAPENAPKLTIIWEPPAGQEYYETASQTLSWAGSNSRTWILSRTFSQGLTFSSSSSRIWSLSRTLSQTITFSSNALADLIQFFQRTASVAMNFVSDSGREWTLERFLSQGFTMTLNANRVFTAIRGVSQSLTATMSVGRTWDLSRTVSQTITLTSNTLADLIQTFQRIVSITLNIVSDSYRGWTLQRVFSQGLTLVSNVERMLGAFRIASQTLTASMNAYRVFSAIRGASQTLTTTMNANRIMAFIRESTQSLNMLFDIFVKYIEWSPPSGTDFVRIVSAGFNLGVEALRNLGYTRIAETSFSIGLDTLRFRGLTRIAEIAFSLQSGVVKILGEVKIRVVNLLLTVSADLGVWFTTVNEFNAALLLFHIIPLALSGIWLKNKQPVYAGVGGMMWFLLALMILQDNPDNYLTVRIYTLFGTIFILLTLVSVFKQIQDTVSGKNRDEFFDVL